MVLLGIALSAFNLRTAVTSLTPLLDVLGEAFGFGAATAGVLGMLPTAAFALLGVSTPALTRHIGLERTALLAMLLAAAGLLLRAWAGGIGALMLGSAIALAGMGIGNVVLPPLVKRYFPARVGAISTLYITVLQLGTMLPALLAVPVAAGAGWRIALGMWALTALVAALPWLLLLAGLRREARIAAPLPVAAAIGSATVGADDAIVRPLPRGRVWLSPVAWGMALMFGTTSLITYAMFTWLPTLLTGAGATPAFGGTMVALFSALGLLGALGMPALAVRIANPFPLVVACAVCHLAAFAGLLLAPMAAPVLWVVLLGLGPSTFPLTLTMINLRTRTPGGSAALSGFMQGVGYAISCLGPLLFGVLHDATGGWLWPFAMLAVAVAVLLAGAWMACRPRWLEDTW
ncbi:MFS transporter [Luteimonas sp. BDR2-5]|uniref:MFS transporter n=1 Tax=Proluteimonas luteida TaxID=2878685 RepID=UPI001E2A7F0C|nr:MFS transporter [Luteimonas sp. BDR2-5]MCD9029591.1 MFS transporter [Luteimonas sp. BDR2-5]